MKMRERGTSGEAACQSFLLCSISAQNPCHRLMLVRAQVLVLLLLLCRCGSVMS
jgi:hypothetical protein